MARSAEVVEARMLAADLCGMEAQTEMPLLSDGYNHAAYKKRGAAGRSLRFYRAMATDHVFRGRVMKWWLIDRKKVA